MKLFKSNKPEISESDKEILAHLNHRLVQIPIDMDNLNRNKKQPTMRELLDEKEKVSELICNIRKKYDNK